jgi:preprotein translocase subunit YajC
LESLIYPTPVFIFDFFDAVVCTIKRKITAAVVNDTHKFILIAIQHKHMSKTTEQRELKPGETVYDESGDRIGTVRGIDEHGFYVKADEDVTVLRGPSGRTEHSDALMWRCWDCGEMGQIENIPEECPSCGASKEEIYYWQED